MWLLFYIYRQFKIKSNKIYISFLRFNTIKYTYNLKEYLLYISTDTTRFFYTSYKVKIVRFIGLLCILLMINIPLVVNLYIDAYGHSNILDLLSSSQAIIVYTLFGFFGWLINFGYFLFLLSTRLLYWRYLTQDEEYSFTHCVLFITKICVIAILGLASFVFIIPALDFSLLNLEIVPPLKFIYAEFPLYLTNDIITPQMASEPSARLLLLRGDEFPGADAIRYLQEKTLTVEKKLHLDFIIQESKKQHF